MTRLAQNSEVELEMLVVWVRRGGGWVKDAECLRVLPSHTWAAAKAQASHTQAAAAMAQTPWGPPFSHTFWIGAQAGALLSHP